MVTRMGVTAAPTARTTYPKMGAVEEQPRRRRQVCAKIGGPEDFRGHRVEPRCVAEPVDRARRSAKRPRKVLVARHSVAIAHHHWINAALLFLLLSGRSSTRTRRSTGANPDFGHGWLAMKPIRAAAASAWRDQGRPGDVPTPASSPSKVHGVWTARGAPGLADHSPSSSWRRPPAWHFFFAWVFAIGAVWSQRGRLRRTARPRADTKTSSRPADMLAEDLGSPPAQVPEGRGGTGAQRLQAHRYLAVLVVRCCR